MQVFSARPVIALSLLTADTEPAEPREWCVGALCGGRTPFQSTGSLEFREQKRPVVEGGDRDSLPATLQDRVKNIFSFNALLGQ